MGTKAPSRAAERQCWDSGEEIVVGIDAGRTPEGARGGFRVAAELGQGALEGHAGSLVGEVDAGIALSNQLRGELRWGGLASCCRWWGGMGRR